MTALRAVVFDLYGTLLHLRDLSFQRLAPRLVAAPRRDWVEFLRDELLVRPFPDRGAMVEAVLARFAPGGPRELRGALLELLERELEAVDVEPALHSVLAFLRRRGLRLAVLTNSASVYREPFEREGLAARFDVVAFSCDLGRRKPQEASYRQVLERLGVAPEQALMAGDSLPNDAEAPAALGMATVFLGRSALHLSVSGFGELAWLAGFETGEVESLLPPFRRVALGDLAGTIAAVELLPDARQGRYNLVAAAQVSWDAGFRERLFVKRYRHPEAIEVELFARALLAEIGIDTNRVAALPGREPLLVAREVTGGRLGADAPEPALAHEIGRHGASAYLFANADFRPRNAFLSEVAGRPLLTLADYEYALFDRVIEVADLPQRFDPAALMALGRSELERRGARRVLTPATMRRARREFFDARRVDAAVVAAFRAGWREVHAAAKAAAPRLERMLRERLERQPPLVIGTEAHRRAFLPLDVDDLLARIAEEPGPACDQGF